MAIIHIPSRLWREMFSIKRSGSPSIRALAVAALGMGLPVTVGLMLGQRQTGFTMGLGATLLAASPNGSVGRAGSPFALAAMKLLPALFAVVAATIIADMPFRDLAIIGLAVAAGLLSGYSRPVAGTAIRFIVYLVLSTGVLNGASAHHGATALVFGLGALWNMILRSLLMGGRDSDYAGPHDMRRAPTSAQRRAHFRKSLRSLGAWQFPLRLALGFGVASGLHHLWPSHHFYWTLLTVALLTQRPVEHVPVKTVQRLAGTVGGVALAGAILASLSSPPALGIAAGLLATLVPLTRARSYLLYSIVVTPLILLVLDIDRPIEPALLTDRLIATLAGGIIVITLNVLLDHLLAAEARGRSGSGVP